MERRVMLTLVSHTGVKRRMFLPEDRARRLIRNYIAYGEDYGLHYLLNSDRSRYVEYGGMIYFTSYRQCMRVESQTLLRGDYWESLCYPSDLAVK